MVGLRSEYLISRNNAIPLLNETRKKPVWPRNGGKKLGREALKVTERHCATKSRTFRIPPLVACLVVKRISGHIYNETRVVLESFLENVVYAPPSQSRCIEKMRSRYVYSYSSTL